jgi:hypothetical protein
VEHDGTPTVHNHEQPDGTPTVHNQEQPDGTPTVRNQVEHDGTPKEQHQELPDGQLERDQQEQPDGQLQRDQQELNDGSQNINDEVYFDMVNDAEFSYTDDDGNITVLEGNCMLKWNVIRNQIIIFCPFNT